LARSTSRLRPRGATSGSRRVPILASRASKCFASPATLGLGEKERLVEARMRQRLRGRRRPSPGGPSSTCAPLVTFISWEKLFGTWQSKRILCYQPPGFTCGRSSLGGKGKGSAGDSDTGETERMTAASSTLPDTSDRLIGSPVHVFGTTLNDKWAQQVFSSCGRCCLGCWVQEGLRCLLHCVLPLPLLKTRFPITDTF
jgi:hypothetical protein